jgi:NADH dehydrogenase
VAQIVILGAGYAGVQAAQALARIAGTHRVVLVDRLPYHQLITQLPAAASGRLPLARTAIPLTRVISPRVTIVRTDVTSIEPAPGVVQTGAGAIRADVLVIGLGGVASDLGVPGALEHAIPLKSVRDARRIVERIRALRASQPLTRVIVIGGGYTGTEVAGELTARSGRRPGDGEIAISIVQPDARLLPQGDPKLSDVVGRILSRRGIAMHFGVWLRAVAADGVTLDSGLALPSDLTIWAARTRPAPAVRGVFTWTPEGRIEVDPYLRAVGSTHTYVAGDLAAATDLESGTLLPASAQVAVPAGRLVGENIIASLAGRPLSEFHIRLLGEALALGARDGAAEVAGVVTRGRLAIAAKRAALLRYLMQLDGTGLIRDYL